MSYYKTTYTPQYMGRDMKPCNGYSDGSFTIYKFGRGWRLAHNKSGVNVFSAVYKTLKGAKHVVKKLHEDWGKQIDWDAKHPLDNLRQIDVVSLKAYEQLADRI